MADIPLTRGQFLLPFVSILDDIGAPTQALLERSRLPSSPAEKSDLYLPLLPALRFVETAQRTQGIEDFGFLAAQRLHFSHMREKTRALIAHSPTLLVALRHACYWASREDTILSMWIEHDDGSCAGLQPGSPALQGAPASEIRAMDPEYFLGLHRPAIRGARLDADGDRLRIVLCAEPGNAILLAECAVSVRSACRLDQPADHAA